MAQTNSFDIVSEVNMQEVDNAVNQARKEVAQRYDLKDSKSSIEFSEKEKTLQLHSLNEFTIKSVLDILENKLVKRGVHLKALKYNPVEEGPGGTSKQLIAIRVGIEKEDAKDIVKRIKDTKLKVQAQIMDDQVRVTGKSRDDLQAIIAALKAADLPFPIQFTNYR